MWLSNTTRHFLLYLLVPVSLSTLGGCYMGRQLETAKTIAIVDESGTPVSRSVEDPKYMGYSTVENITSGFVEGCKNAFSVDNITVVDVSENPDFTLVLTGITLEESKSMHTVDDADSEFNGQTYFLHKCEVYATGILYKGNRLEELKTISATADKEEKVKNNRNLGDLVSGSNKDNNTYRHKELPDNIFEDLSDKCGRRLEAETSTSIYRLIKKGKI